MSVKGQLDNQASQFEYAENSGVLEQLFWCFQDQSFVAKS